MIFTATINMAHDHARQTRFCIMELKVGGEIRQRRHLSSHVRQKITIEFRMCIDPLTRLVHRHPQQDHIIQGFQQ